MATSDLNFTRRETHSQVSNFGHLLVNFQGFNFY